MKKAFVLLAAIVYCHINYAQWSSSLTLRHNQSFADISAPTDKNIWAITLDFLIYKTTDEGNTWAAIHPHGLTGNISILQLYALDEATAFLSVNTDFTGVGPGVLYRTGDGGHNWTKVFSHAGNCEIKMGMFNKYAGLLSCSFSSFNGSVKTGQQLYYTKDGGNHWNSDPVNPSHDYNILSFVVHGWQVAMADYKHVYFSHNAGLTWSRSEQKTDAGILQFEDSSYAVASSSSLISLTVKRPGKGWIKEGDPTGIGGALTGLVLDGSECWFGMGFDTRNNYYSADSAKTFAPLIVDSTSGFTIMTKARNGNTIIGATPFFGSSTLWINRRPNKPFTASPIAIAPVNTSTVTHQFGASTNSSSGSLSRNTPNPFVTTTTIRYRLPLHYSAAGIIVTNNEGKLVQEITIAGSGNGSVQVNAATLSPGTYQYSLIVDGRLVGTKQMVLIK